MSLDAKACLEKGAIGAVGAVPGTLAAHPLDVLKMRMQVTGARLAPTTRAVAASGGVGAFYRGVGPGVAQKIVTRGPMFLLAEACTQLTQRASGLPREQALFVGAAGSGYATGALAAPAEWAKVRAGAGARAATAAASLRQLRPRAHAAGLRNALFDSTFFGVEHALRTRAGLPPGASYALAAALAAGGGGSALLLRSVADVVVEQLEAADVVLLNKARARLMSRSLPLTKMARERARPASSTTGRPARARAPEPRDPAALGSGSRGARRPRERRLGRASVLGRRGGARRPRAGRPRAQPVRRARAAERRVRRRARRRPDEPRRRAARAGRRRRPRGARRPRRRAALRRARRELRVRARADVCTVLRRYC